MNKTKVFKKQTTSGAAAVHVDTQDGNHVVALGNLRVVIVPDGPAWFAQGLEIDYAAQGVDQDDAKKNFQDGLHATIDQHLKINGNIKALLKIAPAEVWQEFFFTGDVEQHFYSCIAGHQVHPSLPYGLNFFLPALTANTELAFAG